MEPKRGRGYGLGLLAAVVLVFSGCGSETAVSSTVASGGGMSDSSAVAASPEELDVGDLIFVDFNSGQAYLDFRDVDVGSKFMLAVGSANHKGIANSIQMSPSLGIPDPVLGNKSMRAEFEPSYSESDGFGVGEIFSAWLRASEEELDLMEVPVYELGSASGFKAMSAKAPVEGETFRVLSSISSTNSYVEVTGIVRHYGSNVVCYVDATVAEDILSDADIALLCGEFDDEAGRMMDLLGDASDVDGDGLVHVLMTPQINRLGALGGGVITGYFYAADLFARSPSNPASNHREIIYTLVPDPSGRYGARIDKNFAMRNLLPAVLPHELQHAISYNQRVFVHGGQPEENWLNEALSHFMEDYMGRGVENPSRYGLYLASPSTYGIVTQGSPNLLERGGAYLFLRYLYEQSANGDEFLRRLVQTRERGVANLINAFQGASGMDGFKGMMQRWSAAVAMTDRGISNDHRYVYRPRQRDAVTGEWKGVCLICDPEDGRGTQLTGVNLNNFFGYETIFVNGATAKYYNITALPHKITLQGTDQENSYAVLIRYE